MCQLLTKNVTLFNIKKNVISYNHIPQYDITPSDWHIGYRRDSSGPTRRPHGQRGCRFPKRKIWSASVRNNWAITSNSPMSPKAISNFPFWDAYRAISLIVDIWVQVTLDSKYVAHSHHERSGSSSPTTTPASLPPPRPFSGFPHLHLNGPIQMILPRALSAQMTGTGHDPFFKNRNQL